MADVFIAAAIRTPFGRYGGRLAALRCDDLAAAPLNSLMARHPGVDWDAVDEVVLGCANQPKTIAMFFWPRPVCRKQCRR
jgi:acetyl-CoA acetyltransferase